MLKNILLVGAGGFIGAICRYAVSLGMQRLDPNGIFPLGTFVANIVGCLFIGLVGELALHEHIVGANAKTFVAVGLLGAFTTFSTFSLETVKLFSERHYVIAGTNMVLQLFLGILFVMAGIWLARAIAS